jgi:hypothetical protein
MSNPLIESSKQSFDPSKFSIGGITKPFITISILLCYLGERNLKSDRQVAITIFVIAGILLFIWVIIFIYLLLKDPIKLRSEKHEQRMTEIEKLKSVNNVSD